MRILVERHAVMADLADLASGAAPDAECIWLDSSAGDVSDPDHDSRGRWSVLAICDGPFGARLTHGAGIAALRVGPAAERWFGASRTAAVSFFGTLEELLDAVPRVGPAIQDCPFALGWMGYMGYECGRESDGPDRFAEFGADAELRFVDRAVVVDHAAGASWGIALVDDEEPEASAENVQWLASALQSLVAGGEGASGRRPGPPDRPDTAARADRALGAAAGRVLRSDYEAAVDRCREEIRRGNAFQICLTTTFHAPAVRAAGGDAYLAEYQEIRRGNPVPFGAYLRLGAVRIAGRSPERFLMIDPDGRVVAEPIKGTRPRSVDEGLDRVLHDELARSPKDRAENVMIVDLLRNDLLRSIVPGSLRVDRLCAVESYPTVHQMVSTISGRLRHGVSAASVVQYAFPPGSMTGAPKISAMAIADRLEGAARGPYSGALGYFSLSGAVDLSVIIRSLVTVLDDEGAVLSRTLGAGGAVTWSSTASEEADEVETKTRSVLGAIGAHCSW